MNLEEFNRVKDMNYLEYCDYLQSKYGIGKCDFVHLPSYTHNKKVSRTSEGLFAHHKMENIEAKLSVSEVAKKYPFEWQKKRKYYLL